MPPVLKLLPFNLLAVNRRTHLTSVHPQCRRECNAYSGPHPEPTEGLPLRHHCVSDFPPQSSLSPAHEGQSAPLVHLLLTPRSSVLTGDNNDYQLRRFAETIDRAMMPGRIADFTGVNAHLGAQHGGMHAGWLDRSDLPISVLLVSVFLEWLSRSQGSTGFEESAGSGCHRRNADEEGEGEALQMVLFDAGLAPAGRSLLHKKQSMLSQHGSAHAPPAQGCSKLFNSPSRFASGVRRSRMTSSRFESAHQ